MKGVYQLVNLGVMAKSVYLSPELSMDQLDGKTWLRMADHFRSIQIVAVSRDVRYRRATTGNIHVFLVPRLPGVVGALVFVIMGSVLALWLTYSRKVAVWSLSEPVSGLSAFPLRALTRAKVVFQLQGELFGLPAESFSWLKRRLVALVTRGICHVAHRIRAVSQRVAEQAVSVGVSEQKIRVVTSRTDASLFDPVRHLSSRTTLRQALSIATDNMVVVFVGRLVPTKGVSFLLQAAAQLLGRTRPFRVLIVGDGPLRGALEAEAEVLGIIHVVSFYGAVPYTQVPAMLAAGDVFVAPSLDEGMPRAVLEALAMSLPVVVSDVGGNKEILSGADCGFLVQPRDVDGLSRAIQCLMDNRDQAIEMGRRGRDLVLQQYNFKPSIRRLAEVHLDLLEGLRETDELELQG